MVLASFALHLQGGSKFCEIIWMVYIGQIKRNREHTILRNTCSTYLAFRRLGGFGFPYLLFFLSTALFSQTYNLQVENVTFPDGRQLANVASVTQDSTGLIWLTNPDQRYIHVYDGKTLRTLDHDQIPGMPFRCNFQNGPDGRHFVFENHTLNSFNPYTWQTDTLIRVPENAKIVRVLFGKNGKAWGQSYGPDLVILSSQNGQPFTPIDTILPEWYYDEVRVRDDFYYVKVKNKVYEYDIRGRTNVFHLPYGPDPMAPSFEIDAGGTFWVSYTPDKVKNEYAVFYKTKEMAGFERYPGSDLLTQGGRFGQFRFDGQHLWFSGAPFKLFRQNNDTGAFEDFTASILQQKGNYPFYKSGILRMFRDRSGQIWIINRGGVSKMLVEDVFKIYNITQTMDSGCPESDCNISGIAEDDAGNIYFTASTGALWALDPGAGNMRLVNPTAGSATMLQHSMGFDQGRLLVNDRVVDVQTGAHRRFTDEITFTDHWVTATDKETHRRWVAAHGLQGKLFQYDAPNPDKLFAYKPGQPDWDVIVLPDSIATGQNVEFRKLMYSRRRGTLLLGRLSKGLVEMTAGGKVIRQDRRIAFTTDMYEDEEGQIWLSADSEQGLIRLDRDLDSLNLQPYHPLPTVGPLKKVYHILPENKEYIWLVSSLGVFRLDLKTGRLTRYPMFPGFARTGFLRLPAFVASDGTFYLGAITGEVMAFHPEEVVKNSRLDEVFRVALTHYSRYDDARDSLIVQQNGLTDLKNIRLTHRDRYFALEFFVPDFRNPGQNKYTWKLDGYENDWSAPGVNNRLQYENLPPGDYLLRIRGGLIEEYYPSSELAIHITVLQAWYKTGWAFLAYYLLIGMTIFLFYHFQLNRRLEQAEAKRLKELDTLKSRLYTNITHEFRTPLTVIMGMTDNIRGHENERKLIRRNSKNLLRLINQLLDLSKLDSGTMKMDMVQGDIIRFLRYLTESFYSMAQEKKVELAFYSAIPDLVMDYDEVKIQHIIYNLLSNALKFTGEGGEVVLQADKAEHNSRPYLEINLRDTGIGIPEEHLAHIFDRFFQADHTSTRKGEGTGIGLALTKELVELMGGNIRVTSAAGKGTTFTLLLPVRLGADTPKPDSGFLVTSGRHLAPAPDLPDTGNTMEEGSPQAGEKPLLLVIEDNADVVAYIVGLLEKDYEIHTASNGQAGIKKALETLPDLIISDVMMPEKDGYEVCATLKNDERTSHIPIILLTARATQADKIAGLKTGADAYLMKPFNKEELFVRLEKLLELRRELQKRYAKIIGGGSESEPRRPEVAEPTLEDIFLQKLRKTILENLDDPDLGAEQLSRALLLSPSQFYRKLAALTGAPPNAFIRKIRLFRAKELLETTGMNISEVAYAVGFNDPNYFSRAFHQEFGKPPSVYRG